MVLLKLKRRAEKLLRKIRASSDADIMGLAARINGDPASFEALGYLEAKGLVEVQRAMGGAAYYIRVLPDGLTYDADQAELRRQRWTDRVVGFFFGVATSVLGYLLTQIVQGAIG